VCLQPSGAGAATVIRGDTRRRGDSCSRVDRRVLDAVAGVGLAAGDGIAPLLGGEGT